MKIIFKVTCFLMACGLWMACEKSDTEFKTFLQDKEIVYPGLVSKVANHPGNNKVMLLWSPSTDPSIKSYLIYWNNGADSLAVDALSHDNADTVKVLIPDLEEYVYSFTIISKDDKGNRSIPMEVNNVKVYGNVYSSALLNRPYNATNPYILEDNGSLKLNFNAPDTINITTLIRYTDKNNAAKEVLLRPDSSSVLLQSYKPGSTIQYRSSYIPVAGAIDTFQVAEFSTFPQIFSYVICDKSLFKEVHLPNDVGTYEPGTSISKLWDGSVGPQEYPNLFHSDGSGGMPHTITFDMGRIYTNLARVEETGRDCCNNPDNFEIWGIADLSGASTTLPASDAGWKAEATAKGWTLLKEVVRTDDGINAVSADFSDNPPPVRYIRIRIKQVTTGDANYSNMSEMTFWNKQ